MPQKVCLIGLDCAAPELVFDRWADLLPNITQLRRCGVWGKLESTIPPITVPAWMCMMTGKDPGTLGIYGFRNRKDYSYEGLQFASSKLVKELAVWEIAGEEGLKSIALGVPLTYPPKPIHGLMITDFLAPDTRADYTFPSELKNEIRDVVGEYLFDTRQFRTEDKDQLLADIYAMSAQRFQLAEHLISTRPWDLFVMVEMGPDRIHHGFWKYFDPQHPLYQPGNPFENAIRDYYITLDKHVGSLLSRLEPGVRVLIVSDHGAKHMVGGFCLNQWLIQEGYLVLKEPVTEVSKFTPDMVDWTKTRVWGDGGYYGRIFLNVKGREPQGVVEISAMESLKDELQQKIEALPDPEGNLMMNKIFRPDSIYRRSRNVAPDLIAYFGDLHWRSVGSVGHPGCYTETNDTGPDDANHAQHGIFIMADAARFVPDAGEREGLSIYDVAPTILETLGVPVPEGVGRGSAIKLDANGSETGSDDAYSAEEEEELARRLEDLGYL
jgi:predicted AlkP superfamily phosphohydrolase/phosphomutase